jgi:CRISPR-associated protein Csm1
MPPSARSAVARLMVCLRFVVALQVFLQAKLIGIDQFLADADEDFETRIRWISLLVEVLPRALLAELGLAKILLGTSAGDQFLVVLPAEVRDRADDFLRTAATDIDKLSAGTLRLAWATTENLGDWSNVRKRLLDTLNLQVATPRISMDDFAPVPDASEKAEADSLFESGQDLRDPETAGWSPDRPAAISLGGQAKHNWSLAPGSEGIALARHTAFEDDSSQPADVSTLAARAAGRKTWGMLRGDVDSFEVRLNRAQTIEEHIQLSVMYKQFFAAELDMLCSMPEFFRKVTLLATGGDDFVLYGSWDALIPFARELQRLFYRFVEANLRELAGNEGKTITMALSVAQSPTDSLASLYRQSGENLQVAKAAGKDAFYVLGRTLEWKQVGDASDTKGTMSRMVNEFGCSPQLLYELASFYRTSSGDTRRTGRARNDRVERPWRFHRRLNRVIGGSVMALRNKEFQRLRTDLIADFTGRNAAQVRLRPAGRVALEWARLETEV